MKIQHGPSFFLLFFITIINLLGGSGCANIVPPLGGPRDTLPPKLVYVTPRDSSKRFNANKIVFYFNEYIDPKDVRTELIVSPVPKTEPIVDARLRTLTVRIKDTLQPNTTYSFNFGNAIRDVNEGNILRGFTYVFSTGFYLDSMTFSGNVLVANTGKVDSTLIVMLHRNLDDSAVVKEKPRYIARVDTLGRFRFRFIEPGKYALYAMKDDAGTRRYLSAASLFAFSDTPVVIGPNTPPSTLYAFVEPDTSKKTTGKSGTGSKGGGNASKEKEKEKDRRLQLQTNIPGGEFDILDTFKLQFTTPLKFFDSTKIRFTDDDYKDIDPKTYQFKRDSTAKLFSMMYTWPTATRYHMILPKDFAEDTLGKKLLKADTLTFHTKKDIDYGEVRVRILNLDLSKKPVLQFVVQDAVKFSHTFKGGKEFRQLLFAPGEYELRVLYDTNGNGTWDSGQFFGKHRQPERVIPIKKKLNVKANWDNDMDITL
ncbi:MAG: Ig-like domain-containing protein [Chitinophagaceae bacterium]|nr:Ig-like domain-containing protein [Chitinophagaceae bacterium]